MATKKNASKKRDANPEKANSKKKPAAKKSSPKKTAASKSKSAKPTAQTAKKKAPAKSKSKASGAKSAGSKKLTKRELEQYRNLLWELRDRITDEMNFLSDSSVRSSSHSPHGGDIPRNGGDAGDQGSVNFDREFALHLMSSESDVIYEIDQALNRIQDGTYGICEMSGNRIEKERLKAIPYARYSVAAKTELEKEQSGRRTRLR